MNARYPNALPLFLNISITTNEPTLIYIEDP